MYFTAVVAVFVPSDMAGRYAAAVIGAIDIALMFILGRLLFSGTHVAVAGALLLLVTPAHFAHARSGTEAIYAVPFVLLWLIALVTYLNGGRLRSAAVGGLVLGLGVYSQPAAPLTMGFLLAVTLAAIWATGRPRVRDLAALPLAFAAPLVPLAMWFAVNPQSYQDTFGRWAIHAAHLRFPLDGVRAFVNWTTLGARVTNYWGFFDPSWLFLDGPSAPGTPLNGAAPFLMFTVLGFAVGVARQLHAGPRAMTLTVLAGLAATPLAASTFGRLHAIDAALPVTVFVVWMATTGYASLIDSQSSYRRVLGWAGIVAMAIEFGRFYSGAFAG